MLPEFGEVQYVSAEDMFGKGEILVCCLDICSEYLKMAVSIQNVKGIEQMTQGVWPRYGVCAETGLHTAMRWFEVGLAASNVDGILLSARLV